MHKYAYIWDISACVNKLPVRQVFVVILQMGCISWVYLKVKFYYSSKCVNKSAKSIYTGCGEYLTVWSQNKTQYLCILLWWNLLNCYVTRITVLRWNPMILYDLTDLFTIGSGNVCLSGGTKPLTHWGWTKRATISQTTTFKHIFLN